MAGRVLFVYRFCGLGGIETAVLNRLSALNQAGIDGRVLFSEYYGEGAHTLARDSRVTVGLHGEEAITFLLQGFDLITVIDHPDFMQVVESAHVRGTVLVETHASSLPALDRLYARLDSPRATAVVVPSQFNRRLVEGSGKTTKEIVVVPNPIDTRVFSRWPRARLDGRFTGGLAAPVVVRVGRLEEEKNPVAFADVAVEVLRSNPATRFLVVGDAGEYDAWRARIEARISAGHASQFTFMRAVAYDEMPGIYSLAAETGGCLVSTSNNESQPMTFLEAMACECPVVSSNVGGVGELIADGVTGRLYPPGAIGDAAAAVRDLLDPVLATRRAGLIANALAMVRTTHSIEQGGRAYRGMLARYAPAATHRSPLVSGIVAFRDGENFLDEAVASVLAQTYRNWELLLVDDGSTDGSTAMARRHAAAHPDRIRYLEHPGHENRGKSASRNLGLAHASGEYVAFLDHDDVWLPHKLQDQVALLEARPEAGLMYGRTRYWHSWTGLPADRQRDGFTVLGTDPDSLVPPPGLLALFLRDERTLASTCSLLVRRAVALEVGGFDDSFTNIYDDVVFLAKLYTHASVFVADTCWDCYRQHAGNSSAIARRTGQWHPRRPNPARERLLLWLERYLAGNGIHDADVDALVRANLAPYREATRRSAHDAFYETCLDAGLAILRGEDTGALLSALDVVPDPDPSLIAEYLFDALPRAADMAPSAWLEVWPAADARLREWLRGLEEKTRAPGLARRAHTVLSQLVAGVWWLRVADGNRAKLVYDPDDTGHLRVAITTVTAAAPWDIQLNQLRHRSTRGEAMILAFRARADGARHAAAGVAQAHPPWSNLGCYTHVELGPEWRSFEAPFTATATDDDARVVFDLGDSAVPVEVAGVELRPAATSGV